MALVLANRVQETATANTTVSFTLTGAIQGFQTFAAVGDTNTTYYSATDAFGNWEVGLGTYSTTGPTLTRTTVYASSNSGLAVTFSGTVNVFLTYPSGRSVNLDASGNVSALGTVASGTWQGSTVGVAYGGTGVTTSSGANSVVLRDSNQNITVNRISQGTQAVTAAGGTTILTAASQFNQTLTGTGGQTYRLPDATTLTDTTTFQFNNNATGTLTITDYASATIGTVAPGGAAGIALLDNSTTGGTWDVHAYIPENVTWGTNSLALGSTVITGGTWNGGTISSAYGGTGLTTFAGANNALYSTSASALAAGTLPVAAGGTGNTSGQATSVANSLTVNNGGAGDASGTTYNGSAARTISYNTVGAPSTTGTNATGTWGINITGNAATATSATTATSAGNLTGGSISGNYTINNATSPNTYYLQFGDNTGWTYRFMTSVSGTPTTRFSFVDDGSFTAVSSLRSPIFYDSNDTSYYVDPASTSNIKALKVNTEGTNSGSRSLTVKQDGTGEINFSSYPGAWTSAITIQDNSASNFLWLSPLTGQGSSWIYSSGQPISFYESGVFAGSANAGSLRAPLFYDSNDTGYYLDPNSTSNSAQRIRGGTLHGPNPTWGKYLYVGTDGAYVGSNATVGVTNGNLHIDAEGGYNVYLAWYNTSDVIVGGGIQATIYYDRNNTGYYCDPSSVSYLYGLTLAGGSYFRPQNWIPFDGSYGLYWPNNNGAHLHANDLSTYTQLALRGSKNSYGGFFDQYSGVNGIMYDSSGNGGVYREANGRWYFYYNVSNDCMGIGTSSTSSTYSLYLNKGVYAQSRVDATIFYDSNDTGYYVDPASTSLLNYAYGLDTTFVAPGSRGTYVWVRAPMGEFNGGGDIVKFTISRSIFSDGSNPYGGPSADITAFSREWHSGQEFCTIVYGEHGSGSGTGGYYISHAGPRDLAGSGYWFYMRLEGGITYKVRRAVSSGYIGNFSATTDPGSVPAINNWGLNILSSGSGSPSIYSQNNITASGNVTAYSDESLKKDWASVAEDYIERLALVKAGTYTRIDSGKRQAGSSAQDWQKLLPEVVSGTETLSLAYGNAALVSAIELAKRVVEQEARTKRLETLIEKLIGDVK